MPVVGFDRDSETQRLRSLEKDGLVSEEEEFPHLYDDAKRGGIPVSTGR